MLAVTTAYSTTSGDGRPMGHGASASATYCLAPLEEEVFLKRCSINQVSLIVATRWRSGKIGKRADYSPASGGVSFRRDFLKSRVPLNTCKLTNIAECVFVRRGVRSPIAPGSMARTEYLRCPDLMRSTLTSLSMVFLYQEDCQG